MTTSRKYRPSDPRGCVDAMQDLAEKLLPKDAEVKLDHRARRRYLDSPATDHWSDADVDDYQTAMTLLRVLDRFGCYRQRSIA